MTKDVEKECREDNLSALTDMIDWLKHKRIPNIQRERTRVDWLYSINIKLAQFIKFPHFDDIHFWRFEDECMYLHMDLTEKDNEGAYWQTKLKDKIEWRDNFFSQFRELLPPTKLKELEKQEQANLTAKRLQTEKDTAALRGNAAIRYMM